MTYFNFLANGTSANLLVNLAWQLTVVSILGIAVVKLLAGKSAPVRSLVSSWILTSLFLVFVASAAFHFFGIAWYKADISRIAEKLSVPADKPLRVSEQTQQESVIHAETEPSVAGGTMKKGARTGSVNTNKFRIGACHFINALGLIWAGGIVFLLLKLCYEMAFLRGFRFGLVKVSDEKFERLLKTATEVFNKKRLPELYTSPKVESPITTGLLNPIVIIPEKLFGTLTEDELKSILLHELAHIYNYDHIIGVFKRIIIAANWWNPAVHIINTEHSIAREEVSDNYVLLELNPKAYSECLAELAEKVCLISSFPATAGMAGKYSSLEQRVKNILSEKRKLSMKTGTGLKLTTTAICCMLALFIAGCGVTIGAGKTTGNRDPYDEAMIFYHGVEQDYGQALDWLLKAAAKDNSEAKNKLGQIYRFGKGVQKDYKKAMYWYEEAAKQDNLNAIANIGDMYREGLGVEKNYEKARDWYLKAATTGFASAQNDLGALYTDYQDEVLLEVNYEEAMKWFQKAAEQGYGYAQYNIGYQYEYGKGVEKDYKKACEWYEKAAQGGNIGAQNSLGNMYYFGRGVEKDYQKAIYWYRKSAEQGKEDSAYGVIMLAMIYALGDEGIEKDYAETIHGLREAVKVKPEIVSEDYFLSLLSLLSKIDGLTLPEDILHPPGGKDNTAPMVIRTNPKDGARDIDPSLTEISVTFNEPMKDKGWSWCYYDKSEYPEVTGQPHYSDDMTVCSLPVKLESGREYVIWLNLGKFTGFRDKAGNSAKPYRFTFKTK